MHEVARRRLAAAYERRGDVRFPDLLNYLECASVEPTGADAMKLTLALRDLHLNAVQGRELLRDAQRALRAPAAEPDQHREVLGSLNAAERCADEGGPPPALESPMTSAEQERADLEAARAVGEQIAARIRRDQQLQIRAVFAALAVAWLFIKPPRPSTEVYMDEAVRDFFPW